MLPTAIACFGGMCVERLTMFVVPALYCHRGEVRLLHVRRVQPSGLAIVGPQQIRVGSGLGKPERDAPGSPG